MTALALFAALTCFLACGCDVQERGRPELPRAEKQPLAASRPQPKPAEKQLPALPAPAPEPAKLPPLWRDDWLVKLEVPGFRDAELALPRGADTPRRVIVALHGYRDRPEWQCGAWTGISEARMFVLCPTGVALPRPLENFSFEAPSETRKEVEAALEALQAGYGPYLAKEPVILVGFSLGAQRAAHLAADDPARFPEVALVEGGTRAWSRNFASKFSAGGGERILFVCTQLACRNLVNHLAKFTESGDVLARGEYLGNFGHQMGADVQSRLKEPFTWLVAPGPNAG